MNKMISIAIYFEYKEIWWIELSIISKERSKILENEALKA
jgi:hypothetical protein